MKYALFALLSLTALTGCHGVLVVRRPAPPYCPPQPSPQMYTVTATVRWAGATWSGSCRESVSLILHGCHPTFIGRTSQHPLLDCIYDEYRQGYRPHVRVTYYINEHGEAIITRITRC
jgi:hypothetical protein